MREPVTSPSPPAMRWRCSCCDLYDADATKDEASPWEPHVVKGTTRIKDVAQRKDRQYRPP